MKANRMREQGFARLGRPPFWKLQFTEALRSVERRALLLMYELSWCLGVGCNIGTGAFVQRNHNSICDSGSPGALSETTR